MFRNKRQRSCSIWYKPFLGRNGRLSDRIVVASKSRKVCNNVWCTDKETDESLDIFYNVKNQFWAVGWAGL